MPCWWMRYRQKTIGIYSFFGQIYWLSGHLLIDRSNRESAIASIKEVTQIVHKNLLSLWIWPEGTRARDGRLTPFKKGFVHLALDTKLPIVPISSLIKHTRFGLLVVSRCFMETCILRYSPHRYNTLDTRNTSMSISLNCKICSTKNSLPNKDS